LPYGYSYTAIKHPVPDRVKPTFVIFDIRALSSSGLSVRVPGCQKDIKHPVPDRVKPMFVIFDAQTL